MRTLFLITALVGLTAFGSLTAAEGELIITPEQSSFELDGHLISRDGKQITVRRDGTELYAGPAKKGALQRALGKRTGTGLAHVLASLDQGRTVRITSTGCGSGGCDRGSASTNPTPSVGRPQVLIGSGCSGKQVLVRSPDGKKQLYVGRWNDRKLRSLGLTDTELARYKEIYDGKRRH